MKTPELIVRSIVIVSVWSAFLPALWAQSRSEAPTPVAISQDEYRAAHFGADEKQNSQRLNELAAEGWEYVGPLGNGMVAFRRSPLVAARLRMVGIWELPLGEEKCRVEFTREGKIKLQGNSRPLAEMFVGVKAVVELKGNPDALSYEFYEDGRIAVATDYNKLEVSADELQRLIATSFPQGRTGTGVSRAFAHVSVSGDELTIRRAGTNVSHSFKRK